MPNRITRVSLVAEVGGYVKSVRTGRRETTELRHEAERFSKGRYEASVKANTAAARTELSALEKRLETFGRSSVDQRVNLDTEEARERLRALQGRLSEFGTRVSDARVGLDDADAQGKLSRLEASLLRLGSRSAEADIDLEGVAAAEGELSALESRLSAFDGNDYRAQVHVDGTLAATRQASAMVDALALLGPALVPLAAAATPALAGITSGLTFATGGAITAGLAFSGVGDALTALNDSQKAAGANAQQSAQAQVTASRQVADARRGVIDAQRGVVQATRDGAQQISAAQDEVAQARRDGADAARDANRQVAEAEDSLSDAHQQVLIAEVGLHDARRQAILDLQDLREETRDNALTVEGAEISVARARQELLKTSRDSTAGELDMREARLQVAEAEDRLGDARRDSRRDTDELNQAEKDGIRGSDQVVTARQRLTDANDGERDAQQNLARAQRNVTRTQAESAAAVVDAQRNVIQATREAAQARAAANRQVADAERTLQRAVADSQTGLASQSTEAQNLAEKMAALGPAGRHFVRVLQDARPELQHLQNIAQAGMFPGMEDGIQDLLDLMPTWERIVRNSASALGQLSREGGNALKDPFWRRFFDYIGDEANGALVRMGRSLGNIAEGLGGVLMALDPLSDDFSGSFLDMTRDFARWGKHLEDNRGFREFVRYVRRVSPEVWDTLTTVADTLLQIAEAAAPVGEVSLPIIRGLARALGWVADSPAGPVLVAAASGMAAINRSIRLYDAAKNSRMVTLIGSMGRRAEGSQGQMSRMGRFLGSGGPWGLALGVGVAALGFFWEEQRKADEEVRGLTDSLNEQSGAITRNTAKKVINAAQEDGLFKQAAAIGVSADTLTRALLGQDDALKFVNRRIRSTIDAHTKWQSTGLTSSRVTTGIGRDATQLSVALQTQTGRLADSRQEFKRHREQQQLTDRVLKNTNDVWDTTTGKTRDNTQATGANEKQLRQIANQLGLTDRETRQFVRTMGDEQGASKRARGDGQLHEKQLRQVAAQADLTRGQTRDLIKAYDDVPKNVDTTFKLHSSAAEHARDKFLKDTKGKFAKLSDTTYAIMVNGQSGHGRIPKGLSFAAGGIQHYAAGDVANGHQAQIARGGVTRVWNEPETGGEVYAPLAPSKRGRSKAIMSEGARLMGGRVEWNADGSIRGAAHTKVQADFSGLRKVVDDLISGLSAGGGGGLTPTQIARGMAAAKQAVGAGYNMGSVGPGLFDCSGAVAYIMNAVQGKPLYVRRGATGNMPWPGMLPGLGGSFQVGWSPAGGIPGSSFGHTAATLDGTNIESSGDVGFHIGKSARGANDPIFKHHAHFVTPAGMRWTRNHPGVGRDPGMLGRGGPLNPDERWILRHEGGQVTSNNPDSSAFGIGQLTSANRVKYARRLGLNWHRETGDTGTTDYASQLAMMRMYTHDRYGNARNAVEFWKSHGWYGDGLAGGVFSKPTLIGVGERGPERVDVTPLKGGDRTGQAAPVRHGEPKPLISDREWRKLRDSITKLTMHQGRPISADWLTDVLERLPKTAEELRRAFIRTRDALRGFHTDAEQARRALKRIHESDRYQDRAQEARRAHRRLQAARSGEEIGADVHEARQDARQALRRARHSPQAQDSLREFRQAQTALDKARSPEQVENAKERTRWRLRKAREDDDKKGVAQARRRLKTLSEEQDRLTKLTRQRNRAGQVESVQDLATARKRLDDLREERKERAKLRREARRTGNADILQREEKAQERLNDRIKAEKQARNEAKKAAEAYRAAQEAAVERARAVTEAGVGLGGIEAASFKTSGGILSSLRRGVQTVRSWGEVTRQLVGAGLRGPILAEYIDAGPSEEAVRTGRSLLAGGQIGEINRLQDQLRAESVRAGAYAASGSVTSRMASRNVPVVDSTGTPRAATPAVAASATTVTHVTNRAVNVDIRALDVSQVSGEIRRQVQHVVRTELTAGVV